MESKKNKLAVNDAELQFKAVQYVIFLTDNLVSHIPQPQCSLLV